MGLYTGGGAYIRNGVNVSNLMGLYTGGLYSGGGLYSEVYGNIFNNKMARGILPLSSPNYPKPG